ncbi:MAG: chemotaxis protein CheW [Pseudomonadota bacterium]|nr:chemotaxis protein CheW [Pseudomonadota bacterium]
MDTVQTSGGMDLSRFEGDFLQEAGEHLAAMENLLVAIDPVAPIADDINAIFRAAHSIKGGSGMFGYADTTAVTHELESLLDKVRKGELALTPDMVDVLLHGADVVRAQLAFRACTGPAPEVEVDAVCERIRSCAVGPAAAPAPIVAQSTATSRRLEITYPSQALDAATVDEVLGQLAELGQVEALPHGDSTKAVIHLITDSADDIVLTLFDFVMDAREVSVREVDANAGAANAEAVATADASTQTGSTEAPAQSPHAEAHVGGAIPPGTSPSGASAQAPNAPRAAATATASSAAAAHQESIRVSVEKVDQLINQVGELVITQAMLAQCIGEIDAVNQARLLTRIADLQRNTRDLQESVMSIRMLPIASVFERFPRLARDLAGKLGKEVHVRMEGENTELDKGLIEKIMDPLVHLVRNAIDHGIERVEDRLAAGKLRTGTLTLTARHQGGNILIEVCDDGRGLCRDRILAKARERGMAVSDTATDREVWALIFEPGFSTAEVVTDVSGRGVGMDVVKRNIASLSGSILIDSRPGAGTRVSIRLPLTLAIMDGLAVAVGEERYIVPLAGILESLQTDRATLRSVAGQGLVIDVRDEFLPVVFLSTLFGIASRQGDCAAASPVMIVVVETEGTKVALAVDELLGQNQVVVKSLDANYRRVPGLAGATIMGDGRVACILDLGAIVRHSSPAQHITLH